jgi:hypothetical protein
MANIDDMTYGELKKIAAMFNETKPIAATNGAERAVVVCTDKRGVFFGYATDTSGDRIKLRSARNAYYWAANQGGVLALGSEGPRKGSKIGDRADIEISGITAVIECSPEATKAWEAATWAV